MVVVDTSVAYKWFAPKEENHPQALKIYDSHAKGGEIVVVPDLLLYELVNAWVTKTAIPLKTAKRNLQDLKDAHIQFENITFDLIEKAIAFSKKHDVSVYDATYVVLAKEKGCNLVTADNKFADQVNLRFVKKLADYGKMS